MAWSSPTKKLTVQQCLICNQATTDPNQDRITVKTEVGQVGTAEPVGLSPSTVASLDAFCKLLQLSAPCTNSLLTDVPTAAGHAWPVFCTGCQDTITNINDLFEQIRRLQLQIDGSRNQVETQIQQCFSDHVASSGGSLALHSCKSGVRGRGRKPRLQCSAVDQFRELIVTDIHAKAANLNQVGHEVVSAQTPRSLVESRASRAPRSRKTAEAAASTSPSGSSSRWRSSRKAEDPEVILGDLDHNVDDDDKHDIDFNPGLMEHQSDSDSDRQVLLPDLDDIKLKSCAVKLKKIDGDASGSPKVKKQKSSQPRQRTPRPSRSKKSLFAPREKVKKLKKKGKRATMTCELCPAVFQGEYFLQHHYNKLHGTTQFATFCSTCGKRFYTEASFETHLRRQGGTCRKFQIPDTVTVQMEPGTPNFKCKLCPRTTGTRERMRNHHMTHTKEKRFSCETCGLMFKMRISLIAHQLKEHSDPSLPHRFRCPEPGCGRLLLNKGMYDRHMQTHAGTYNFFCDRCPYKTIYPAAFKTHVEAVHEDVRKYPCTHCPKKFKKSTQLQKHIYSAHTAPEDRPFKCGTCGKTFSEKYCLDRHEIIHTSLKPIQCKICDKRFAVSDYLRMHMKVHNGRPRSKAQAAAAAERKAARASKSASANNETKEDVDVVETGEITISEVNLDFDGTKPTTLLVYGP